MYLINYLLRKIFENLSFFFKNKTIINKKKEYKTYEIIIKKLSKIKDDKNNLKKTHIIFNNQIKKIIFKKDLKNLLRYSFVQKMFFIHNRLFISKELNKIRKSKKWNIYKKPIIEDNICNPVRYFLYPKSSGNRIHQIFHLYFLEKNFNISTQSFSKIFELGGGYGCLARIFNIMNKKITSYTLFDTKIVNLIQYYYLKHLNCNVGFQKKNIFFLTNKISNTDLKYDLFIANWSLSEMPLKYRNKFIKPIKNSKFLLISFQEKFEDIDNLQYFLKFKKKLKNKFIIKIIKNKFYKGSPLKKHNHYYFIGKKL